MKKQLFILLTLAMSSTLSAETKMQNRELPAEELKTQNKTVAKMASLEISKSLPQKIDKFTTLTSAQAKEATIIYTYELDIATKSDETIKKEDHTKMKEAITKGSCIGSKRFLDADIALRYIYISKKTKAELFQFNIDKKSCSN